MFPVRKMTLLRVLGLHLLSDLPLAPRAENPRSIAGSDRTLPLARSTRSSSSDRMSDRVFRRACCCWIHRSCEGEGVRVRYPRAAMRLALLALLVQLAGAAGGTKWEGTVTLASCNDDDPHQRWSDSTSGGPWRDVPSGRCLTATATSTTAEGYLVTVDACDDESEKTQEWRWEKDDGEGNKNAVKLNPLGTCPGPLGGGGCCLDSDLTMTGIVQTYACHAGHHPDQKNQEFTRQGGKLIVGESASAQCAKPPCCLSAAAPPPGCFEAGACRKITSGWGLIFLLGISASVTAYGVGGVGYAVRAQGKPAVITSHPHYERWVDASALLVDGVRFSRGKVLGADGADYSPVPSPRAADLDVERPAETRAHQRRDAKSTKEKRKKEKKGTKEKKTKEKKKGNSSRERRREEGSESPAAAAAIADDPNEAAAAGFAGALKEQKEQAGLHSSQAKITVVGLG